MLATGNPRELLHDSEHEVVRRFLSRGEGSSMGGAGA
jgi:hypothetical protein